MVEEDRRWTSTSKGQGLGFERHWKDEGEETGVGEEEGERGERKRGRDEGWERDHVEGGRTRKWSCCES